MNIYDEEFAINVAECTAVLATALEEDGIKLGGAGLIAHYCAVAQYGLEVANLFPPGYDWDEYMSRGGDCWDMEVWDWMHKRLHETGDISFEYWEERAPTSNPWRKIGKRQDIDLTLPE